jgi:acyl-CoA synthetase (AMP-forming)/AMP-acid ligase II
MKPIDDEVCECVVLDGHRGKVMSNSDDPPNSYHTKDLFIGHPTIPNAWKFVGRLDDRITLTNGEKVLPLPIEGRIQQDPLVKEAVVFGVDRPLPGLLLFRAASAAGLSDDEFLDRVWPVIEDANSRAEGFSQISRDLVAVIPEDVDCPSTDKSSIKRTAVYREFADVIEAVYAKLEDNVEGTLKLSVPELEQWVMKSFAELGIRIDSPEIQMRGHIVKNLDLGGNVSKCASMIVYDCGNAAKLARTLYAIRTGDSREGEDSDDIPAMSSLIERFSTFEQRSNRSEKLPVSHVVVSCCSKVTGLSDL